MVWNDHPHLQPISCHLAKKTVLRRKQMHEFFRAYYDRLQIIHEDIAKAISDLPVEALDWQPGPSMNSLAVLVVHTAGAERYWIGDVAGQDPSGRVRSEEFKTSGLEKAELQERLEKALAHSYGVLQELSVDELDVLRHSWRDDETYSVAWALVHALEHSAMHLGHIQIGCELWLMNSVE
jgi:uncharacterized damage-inducible protein DinB